MSRRGLTAVGLAACAAITEADEARACYAEALSALVRDADDPTPALEEIAVAAYSDSSGRLLADCHGLMHTVGREYARDHEVTLETLMAYLSRTNEPGVLGGFAAMGADETQPPETVIDDPRELCGPQADAFVRPCWYRAFIDDRPDQPVESAEDILALCSGLDGLQRQACITAASVVGPVDPREQLSLCAELEGAEAVSCIRGTKVQNLLTAPPEDLVAFVRPCDGFAEETTLAC